MANNSNLKTRLPGLQTEESGKCRSQYVVMTAGGARQSPDRGDHVIAYRLDR